MQPSVSLLVRELDSLHGTEAFLGCNGQFLSLQVRVIADGLGRPPHFDGILDALLHAHCLAVVIVFVSEELLGDG